MITDKDRAELKELTKQIRKSKQTMQWFDYGWDDCAEIIMQYVNKKCAESADQARKEAADRADIFCMTNTVGLSIGTLLSLRAAILGDSAPVSTDSREETRKAIDGELKNADLYLESQRSLHKAEAMIRAMRNALKIIVSNTLNPAKTMTKLGA